MRRAFVVMITLEGTVLGWLVAIFVQFATESLTAHFIGAIVACLYVGAVFGAVRTT